MTNHINGRKLNIRLHGPQYTMYTIPNGYLTTDRACHALWHYYLAARSTYERVVVDPIVFEGHEDPTANYSQLFTSIANMYGVEPEVMAKFWPNVDMQAVALVLPKMPAGDFYRFNSIPELNSCKKN